MQIEVMSREAAENHEPKENEVCISISSFNPDYPFPVDSARVAVLSDKFVDVLRLVVDDIDPDRFDSHREQVVSGEMKAMSREQADEIAAFVRKHQNSASKMVIHCYMGISRSRSTAAAVATKLFMKEKFDVCNVFVYNRVCDALV